KKSRCLCSPSDNWAREDARPPFGNRGSARMRSRSTSQRRRRTAATQSRAGPRRLLIPGLIRKISEVLLHQRAVFLRVFLCLRLLQGGAIAVGKAGESGTAGHGLLRPSGAAGAVPVSFVAGAVGTGLSASAALPIGLALALAFAWVLAFALPLSLSLSLLSHGRLGADARLGEGEGGLGLGQGFRGGHGALLRGTVLATRSLCAAA